MVTTDFGGSDFGYAVAIQPDGRIVVGGDTSAGTTFGDFALARYEPDGSLDASFASGKVTTDIGGTPNGIRDLALQADGKILAAGQGQQFNRFAFARYNADGSLDQGFGLGGTVSVNVGGAAFSIALQPDGRIVSVGGGFAGGFALARLNVDGTLDPSSTAMAAS